MRLHRTALQGAFAVVVLLGLLAAAGRRGEAQITFCDGIGCYGGPEQCWGFRGTNMEPYFCPAGRP